MPQDYTDINLDEKFRNKDSLAVRKEFINSISTSSIFDTGAITTKTLNRNSIFKFGTVNLAGTFELNSGVGINVHVGVNFIDLKKVMPFTSLVDIYVDVEDQPLGYLWNSGTYGGDQLTNEQKSIDYTSNFGNRFIGDKKNKLDFNFEVDNNGTDAHIYFVYYKMIYVPLLWKKHILKKGN